MSSTSENKKWFIVAPPSVAVVTPQRRRHLPLSPVLYSVAAAIGIFGGLSSLFVGLVCIVVHALVQSDQDFDKVGTVLLIAGIPMMLLGSIFLDSIHGNQY